MVNANTFENLSFGDQFKLTPEFKGVKWSDWRLSRTYMKVMTDNGVSALWDWDGVQCIELSSDTEVILVKPVRCKCTTYSKLPAWCRYMNVATGRLRAKLSKSVHDTTPEDQLVVYLGRSAP